MSDNTETNDIHITKALGSDYSEVSSSVSSTSYCPNCGSPDLNDVTVEWVANETTKSTMGNQCQECGVIFEPNYIVGWIRVILQG